MQSNVSYLVVSLAFYILNALSKNTLEVVVFYHDILPATSHDKNYGDVLGYVDGHLYKLLLINDGD